MDVTPPPRLLGGVESEIEKEQNAFDVRLIRPYCRLAGRLRISSALNPSSGTLSAFRGIVGEGVLKCWLRSGELNSLFRLKPCSDMPASALSVFATRTGIVDRSIGFAQR